MPPRRRTTDLLVEDLGTELVVYDVPSHRVHRLNAIAAAVWLRCDGATRQEAIVDEVARGADGRVRRGTIERALKRLRAEGLVHDVEGGSLADWLTRRDVLGRLAAAAAAGIAGPAVVSMLSPPPLMAQSRGAEACETSAPTTDCFCTGCSDAPPAEQCTEPTIGMIVIQTGAGVCIPSDDKLCGGRPCTSRIAYQCVRPNIWRRRRDLDDRTCITV